MSDASTTARGPGEMMGNAGPGMLDGVRVIEVADEQAEYTGLLLAGLGAEVIKVEPPEGNATRRIGPFREDRPDTERSLFFWHYNRSKQSVVLDLRRRRPRPRAGLLQAADVLLDASRRRVERSACSRRTRCTRFPALVIARVTPFGDDGPWAGFKGSDLFISRSAG